MLGFHLRGFVVAVAAGVLTGLVTAAVSGRTSTAGVVVAVMVVFAVVIGRGMLRCRRMTYTITSRRLTIEVGLLGRQVHETRLEQIQNVSTSQSLLERALGVGDVSFDTAGGTGFDFSFRGVADPRRIMRSVDEALHRRLPSRV